jgi:hypothetical protein
MANLIADPNDESLNWREFLTDKPPGSRSRIDRAAYQSPLDVHRIDVPTPELQLFCDRACKRISYCKGKQTAGGRLFGDASRDRSPEVLNPFPHDAVIKYSCEACGRVVKSFAIRFWNKAKSLEEAELVEVQKIGEWPPFAPKTPGKLVKLIGPDRELFLQGRRAEIEGLGIGAFSYYRRIVEKQKNRLLDEIIRVARHIGAPEDALVCLENAKSETQFSKAVESVKAAIPAPLFIKGHNPLTLLHAALSEGLHDASDEQCLTAANDIRLILIELSERLSEAMKEQRELDSALSRLINRKN